MKARPGQERFGEASYHRRFFSLYPLHNIPAYSVLTRTYRKVSRCIRPADARSIKDTLTGAVAFGERLFGPRGNHSISTRPEMAMKEGPTWGPPHRTASRLPHGSRSRVPPPVSAAQRGPARGSERPAALRETPRRRAAAGRHTASFTAAARRHAGRSRTAGEGPRPCPRPRR